MDDFLYPREHRYARGRDSAEGFYRDSVNVKDFLAGVVTPLSMPDARIRTAAFDHVRDLPIEADPVAVPSEGIVVVDGIFLHRRELAAVWDVSVFLDAPFTVTVPRMARRDGGSPDPRDASNRRYVGGQRLYLDECRPTHLATVVVDMTDLSAPRVVPGADRDSWAIPDDLP